MNKHIRSQCNILPFWLSLWLAGLLSFGAYAKPANMVLIMADDLNSEVFSHNEKILRLIARQGMTFENHFVSLSLCCPSRTSILRGQYAHNTGVFGNLAPHGGFAKVYQDGLEHSTVATWLQTAGYRTALIGKYLNGYPSAESGLLYIPPGWDYWVSPNGGKPYTEYEYSLNENGKTVWYGKKDADYMVDVLAAKAVSFIKDHDAQHGKQAFFLYLTPYAPHGPATPPSRYANDFPKLQAPRPPSFNEENIHDKPEWLRSKKPLSTIKINEIDALYRKRRQSMKAVGDLVETVVDTLKAVGELDNTYIFFTSDNGFHQGQHRLKSGKNTAFEEDINVPLVVRGPGIAEGVTVSALTANVDFAPTFAEIAHAQTPVFVDGRSLIPLLHGRTTPKNWRKVLLLEHGESDSNNNQTNPLLEPKDAFDLQINSPKGIPPFTGLRTCDKAIGHYGALTYVEYVTGEHELYWLNKDPFQLRNVYPTADPTLKTTLSSWLGLLQKATGQTLRDLEQTAP